MKKTLLLSARLAAVVLGLTACTSLVYVSETPIVEPTVTQPFPSATESGGATAGPVTTAIPTPVPTQVFRAPELVRTLGRGIIRNMAISPDGQVLVVASTAGVWIYELATGEVLTNKIGRSTIRIPYSDVAEIRFNTSGSYLAVSQGNNGVWIWETRRWSLVTEREGSWNWKPGNAYAGFSWSPTADELVLVSSPKEADI